MRSTNDILISLIITKEHFKNSNSSHQYLKVKDLTIVQIVLYICTNGDTNTALFEVNLYAYNVLGINPGFQCTPNRVSYCNCFALYSNK